MYTYLCIKKYMLSNDLLIHSQTSTSAALLNNSHSSGELYGDMLSKSTSRKSQRKILVHLLKDIYF